MIESFKKIKEYSASFDDYNIYDYCFYICLTNVKNDIPKEELELLIKKCSEVHGDYTDPISIGQLLANEIYEEKNITIDQIKSLSVDDFYDWYNNGKELGNPLEIDDIYEREVD